MLQKIEIIVTCPDCSRDVLFPATIDLQNKKDLNIPYCAPKFYFKNQHKECECGRMLSLGGPVKTEYNYKVGERISTLFYCCNLCGKEVAVIADPEPDREDLYKPDWIREDLPKRKLSFHLDADDVPEKVCPGSGQYCELYSQRLDVEEKSVRVVSDRYFLIYGE